MTSREDAVRQLAIGQCLYQMKNCIDLIENVRTKPETRARRVAILKGEIDKMEQLDPNHAVLPGVREQLNIFMISYDIE